MHLTNNLTTFLTDKEKHQYACFPLTRISPHRCDASTLRRFDASTLRRSDASTFRRFNASTLRRFDASTLRRFDASTLRHKRITSRTSNDCQQLASAPLGCYSNWENELTSYARMLENKLLNNFGSEKNPEMHRSKSTPTRRQLALRNLEKKRYRHAN